MDTGPRGARLSEREREGTDAPVRVRRHVPNGNELAPGRREGGLGGAVALRTSTSSTANQCLFLILLALVRGGDKLSPTNHASVTRSTRYRLKSH